MVADDGHERGLPNLTVIDRLAQSAADGDAAALERIIDELLAALPPDQTLARPLAHRALSVLQEARAFAPLTDLAQRLIRRGIDTPEVRRRYSQALVDTGQPVAALALLENLTTAGGTWISAAERDVALGVMGRARKQLYVESRQAGEPGAVRFLKEAIGTYSQGIQAESARERRWCMINLVALLSRGARDGDLRGGRGEAHTIARRLIAELASATAPDDLTEWDQATLGEAHVALGEFARAAHWYGSFAEDRRTMAFHLASAIRQLEEIWGLSVADADGGPLVTALKAKLIGLSSGTISLSSRDRSHLLDLEGSGAELEAVLGRDGPMRIGWLKDGLRAARSVGRIRDRLSGATYGTGFLVRGGDLRSDLGDEPLVLTNSHVVSDRPGAALGLADAEILFDESEDAPAVAFGELVFEAPADSLDTAVLRLQRWDDRAPSLPLVPLDYLRDHIDHLPEARRRAIVMGHAGGRELAVSLADTQIVDIGYRDAARQGALFVHYRSPTAPGNSGSPVFTPERWQVAALHHAGPSSARGLRRLSGVPGHHRANEGIAISSIVMAMARTSRPVALPPAPVRIVEEAAVDLAPQVDTPHPLALPEVRTAEELTATLKRLDIPERELRRLLDVDRSRSDAFAPAVVARPGILAPTDSQMEEAPAPAQKNWLDEGVAESMPVALVEGLNAIARWRRQRAYAAKVSGGWTGLRFVAQGDSWFQYPFLLEDVVDQLFDEHAILDLSGAGRTLHDLGVSDELVHAVKSELPNGVLLSGGGNDILGEHAIKLYLRDFAPGLAIGDYAEPTLAAHLELIVSQYDRIIRQLIAVSPSLRIFCHGYDWAIPNAERGDWLARPMALKGIVATELQRSLVRLLIDRFNEAMRGLERRYPGRVLVVDCRGAVGSERWYDELHPTDAGFADVAQRFRKRIAKAFDLAA
ncbi:MAG: trypsin-like peptidase domain-containing protein [Hyphomicrobiaceae bacterium]